MQIQQLLDRTFDYRSKAGRKEFFLSWLVALSFVILMCLPVSGLVVWLIKYGPLYDFFDELIEEILTPGGYVAIIVWVLLAMVGGMFVSVAQVIAAIRRLHDIEKSGWFWFLYLVPLLNLFFFVFLLFVPGRTSSTKD